MPIHLLASAHRLRLRAPRLRPEEQIEPKRQVADKMRRYVSLDRRIEHLGIRSMVFSQVGFFKDKFAMCNPSHIAIFCPRRADFEKGTPPWTRFASARGDRMPDAPRGRATVTPQCRQTSKPRCLPAALALPFALSALLVGEVLLRDVERAVLSLNVAA